VRRLAKGFAGAYHSRAFAVYRAGFFQGWDEPMKPGNILWLAGMLLWAVGGCATPGEPGGVSAETATSGAVMSYRAGSPEELAWQAALAVEDGKARVKIPPLLDAAQDASARYYMAAKALAVAEVPPGAERPTKEEVAALRKKASDAWSVVIQARQEQVDKYREFLAKYPKNWYVRHRLAWFMADHELRPEAAEEWRKVIELEPKFPYAYNNLGSLYNHMGRDMEAIDLFLKAIELRPDDATFYTNLAANYSLHKREVAEKFGWTTQRVFEETLGCYRKALELAPTDKAVAHELATQYVLAERFGVADTADEAIAAWRYYLKLDLNSSERAAALRNMGRIYLTEKRHYAEAVKCFERATALMPDATNQVLLQRAREALGGSGE